MSSEIAGVQAKIKEISPLAIYTHCYAHCLNLCIAASCKAQEVRNLIGLINEVYLFLANSPKRQRAFELTLQLYLPESGRRKLPGLCKTRWVERHTCLEVFLEIYEPLVTFFDAIIFPHSYPELLSSGEGWSWDQDTKVKAQGFKSSLSSFQTITTFVVTKTILDEVKPIAAKFQKRDRDVMEAYGMVDKVLDSVKKIRSSIYTCFSLWYQEVLQLAEKIGVSEIIPRKTSMQGNRSNVPSESPPEHYKRAIAIPLLDSLINQLEDRYNVEGRHAHSLLCLVPTILLSSGDIETEGLHFWQRDLPFPNSLVSEARRWKALWHSTNEGQNAAIPDSLLSSLASCDIDSFPNIHSLLVIACTLPITSAEAERSFSLMRRIKNYTRSTMTEGHLSDLAVMAIHYGERVPIDQICHSFCQAHPRRLFQGCLFAD